MTGHVRCIPTLSALFLKNPSEAQLTGLGIFLSYFLYPLAILYTVLGSKIVMPNSLAATLWLQAELMLLVFIGGVWVSFCPERLISARARAVVFLSLTAPSPFVVWKLWTLTL